MLFFSGVPIFEWELQARSIYFQNWELKFQKWLIRLGVVRPSVACLPDATMAHRPTPFWVAPPCETQKCNAAITVM